MSETDKKYLTPNEVGHRLGIHRNTVTAMIKDGRFPGSFVIGTRWRVPESAYDSFVRNQGFPPKKNEESPE